MRNSSVAAASATYRKAVIGIAEALNKEPSHSQSPSHDLNSALEGIPEALKEKAIDWYTRGIKRGLAKAIDLMAEQKIYHDHGTVYVPRKIKIKVKMKISGHEREQREIEVLANEVCFK